MKKTIFLILAFIVFSNCEKEEQITKDIEDGIYTGTFQRKITWSEVKQQTLV